jgi:hypothetical protein
MTGERPPRRGEERATREATQLRRSCGANRPFVPDYYLVQIASVAHTAFEARNSGGVVAGPE